MSNNLKVLYSKVFVLWKNVEHVKKICSTYPHMNFEFQFNEYSDIVSMRFGGNVDVVQCRDILQEIANCISCRSVIDVCDDDNRQWRFYFDGSSCQLLSGKIVYEQPYDRQIHDNDSMRYYAQILLLYKMKEISECYYSSGWEGGLEYNLWNLIVGCKSDMDELNVDLSRIEAIRALHFDAGGWWMYGKKERRPVFVNAIDWMQHLHEKGINK